MPRLKANVYNLEGKTTEEEVGIPAVFQAPIRPDIVSFVHKIAYLNSRQSSGVSPRAGHQTSAESWGTGRAVSRIPRVPGGGTHRAGQGAFGNMCRGGHMFAPLKPWRRWGRRVNKNIRRTAMASAVAATAITSLVIGRGHRIWSVNEMPYVVDDSLLLAPNIKEFMDAIKALGLMNDFNKAKSSKQRRPGKGKMRNRRYRWRKGPLIIYKKETNFIVKNKLMRGLDFCNVTSLDIKKLAPGGVVGRFVLWTKSAFEELDKIFGDFDTGAQLKEGFLLPRPIMSNTDMERDIKISSRYNELPFHIKFQHGFRGKKPNPARNKKAFKRLNPYAAHIKEQEKEEKKVEKEEEVEETEEYKKAKEIYEKLKQKESDFVGDQYEDFSRWLGLSQ